MSVKVLIPTPLRNLTNDQASVEATGANIAAVFDDLEAHHPGLKERLCDAAGEVRRFVNVFVADDDVRFLDGLATPVPDGETVAIIPAVAGG